MSQKLYSLGEVARFVNVPPYKIAYAISVGHLPDAQGRIAGKRAFSEDDVERVATHFRAETSKPEGGVKEET